MIGLKSNYKKKCFYTGCNYHIIIIIPSATHRAQQANQIKTLLNE